MVTLKDLRINSDITQIELANLFGVVPATIANAERNSNNIKYALLSKYMLAFNVGMDDIFLGSECRLSALYEERKKKVIASLQQTSA
jgi:transcriptional regulator with XRE-family HTH domain